MQTRKEANIPLNLVHFAQSYRQTVLNPDILHIMRKPREYFNRHLDQDLVDVLDASSALDVTEFRLFELAYRQWYGKSAHKDLIERQFAAYMFTRRVPGWVRHFSRNILKLQAQGKLDPKSFGVWQRLPSARMILFAKFYTAGLLIVFLLTLVLIYGVPESAWIKFDQCYFPPCY